MRFAAHKKTKIISGFAMCQAVVHFIVYLESIRGVHKSDPCIPRIELACHSSSEVSTVDLYALAYLCFIYIPWFKSSLSQIISECIPYCGLSI